MTTPPQESDSPSQAKGGQLVLILLVFVCLLLGLNWFFALPDKKEEESSAASAPAAPSAQESLQKDLAMRASTQPVLGIISDGPGEPRSATALHITNIWDEQIKVEYWFDGIADWLRESSLDTGDRSNIRPQDYAGPETCKECHPGNYDNWRGHAHRRMNELATSENVLGDFSGASSINFLGGVGKFYTDNGEYRMALEKNGSRRVYDVQRTIGSRFFQYYVGKLIEGPDNNDPRLRNIEHVLPFGYWLDAKEWVPAVRTFRPEDADHFPYDPYGKHRFAPYDVDCGNCHTTMPMGDWMVQPPGMGRTAQYTPRSVHFHFSAYLDEIYPGIIGDTSTLTNRHDGDIAGALEVLSSAYPTRTRSVSLGISCEACHHGAAAHVANSTKDESSRLPSFFPVSPHLFLEAQDAEYAVGKTDLNRNFICAKCHTGERTEYTSGNHTFNSTEYSDAVRGACYDPEKAAANSMRQLTCVHCHEPHKGIGKKWTPTPQMDDNKCLQCHQNFEPAPARVAHTHHPMGSPGARCMNCHMPKIMEGMQDVTRTHRIFSPNHAGNIEGNHPNACNLCHLEENIDWTLSKLNEWYGFDLEASEAGVEANYPQRDQAVGLGWLTGDHHATRLSAAQALILARQSWAVPALIDQLDSDPFLINRQLTQAGLDKWLGVKLRDLGYQFYMTPEERRKAIARLRPRLLKLDRPKAPKTNPKN